jgi:hypothetical protein
MPTRFRGFEKIALPHPFFSSKTASFSPRGGSARGRSVRRCMSRVALAGLSQLNIVSTP